MKKKDILCNQPTLPSLEDLNRYLEEIWATKSVTNNGPFHQQLETALCEYLGVDYISLFSSGTTALLTAIKFLDLTKEVITTPYSFVATSHALRWLGITPVFIDVEPRTFTMDANKIEDRVSKNTTGIMPVHVYGYPCDTESISEVAKQNDLKVIYDAAHAFGVNCHCGSILNHGDLSVLSFHATKVFHTLEGGAIVSHTLEAKRKIDRLKNFGFLAEGRVDEVGINGKLNEVSSAIGLLQLRSIDEQIEKRKALARIYRERFANDQRIACMPDPPTKTHNYGYFPILVTPDYPLSRDALHDYLQSNGVMARRYFYPLISDLKAYSACEITIRENLKIARSAANSVICLPIHSDLPQEHVNQVADIILKV